MAAAPLSDRAFERLRLLVATHSGIAMTEAKRDLLCNRLQKRLRARGFTSYDEYCALLESGDVEEIERFVNSVTTNLTGFFREPHHFAHLAESLRARAARPDALRRLRVWSAGCSTGEEPYSIAITLAEVLPDWRRRDVKVLATDLDSQVLATAGAGSYPLERVAHLDRARLHRWFRKGVGANEGRVRVSPELQAMVTFRRLSLMEPWPVRGPFDALFCRNVIIYFDKDTQRRLFDRFAQLMPIGGLLYIGHSETLFRVTERFRSLGQTTYERVA